MLRLLNSILFLLAVTVPLFALPKPPADDIIKSTQALALHKAKVELATMRHYNKDSHKGDVMKKWGWIDAAGSRWEMSLIWLGYWDDLFEATDANQHWPEHYGQVLFTASTTLVDDVSCYKESKQVQYLLFYPTFNALLDLGLTENQLDQLFGDMANDRNRLIPLKYMTPSFVIFDDLENTFTVPGCVTDNAGNPIPSRFFTRYTTNSNGKYTWCALQSTTPTDENDKYYYEYPGFGTLFLADDGGTLIGGPTHYSSLKFTRTVPDTVTIKGGMSKKPGANSAWNYNLRYIGQYIEMMETPSNGERGFDIGEIHIINTGMCSSDNWPYYDDFYGPLTRFYLLACSPDYTFPSENFTTSSINPVPEPVNQNAGPLCMVKGALFSPEYTDEPTGTWRQQEIFWEYNEDDPLETRPINGPREYSCLEPAFGKDFEVFQWSELDGLWLTIQGEDSYFPMPRGMADVPIVMNGTPEGFGVYGRDIFSTPVRLNFKGDIIYHYFSEDYHQTRFISAVGDESIPYEWNGATASPATYNGISPFKAIGSRGEITINAPEACTLQIFNMQGNLLKTCVIPSALTHIAMPTGIYILKAQNGCYATKVVVR